MAYIKAKKIWTKEFSAEELSSIWDMFIEVSPYSKEEWENKKFIKVYKDEQFIHPETDKWDDTEGVQPKQIKKLLERYTLEEIKKIFKLLSTKASKIENYNGYIEDGFISWERFVDLKILNMKIKRSAKELIGYFLYNVFVFSISFRRELNKEAYELIAEKPFLVDFIAKNEDIKIEEFWTSFLSKRKEEWKEIQGFIPRVEQILLINPKNWDKRFLFKIEELFGTKQLNKLEEEELSDVVKLINTLGINIIEIHKDIIEGGRLYHYFDYNINNVVKDVRPIIKKVKDFLPSIHNYYLLVSLNEESLKYLRKQTVSKEDLELVFYIDKLYRLKPELEKSNIPLYFWKTLKRYGVLGTEHVSALFSLYKANKNKNTTIPLIKGKVGSYSYEVLKKDNPLGLILGYATDCCQVIGNQGESCLRAGYTKGNSTFFAVTKKNKIYAQSWVWETTNSNGEKIFCFDSIEVLGKDLEKSKDILRAYQEVAQKLYQEGYDFVITGADGNTIPKGLEVVGEFEDSQFTRENFPFPFSGVYTDIGEGVYIFNKGKDNV